MSTLGFGDITFTSDIGKLFSIIVLVSGIILIMIVMPFTFIRFVYQPWIEEYNNKRKPRSLPSDTSGHTVLVGDNDISLSVARKLRQHNYPYVILVPDGQHALELYDNRYDVVTGEFDDANTYRNLRAEQGGVGRSARRGSAEYEHRLHGARSRAVDPARRPVRRIRRP